MATYSFPVPTHGFHEFQGDEITYKRTRPTQKDAGYAFSERVGLLFHSLQALCSYQCYAPGGDHGIGWGLSI